MKTVAFINMKDGTKEEYLMLDKYEQDYINRTADRILKFMGGLDSTLEGYKITRLEHSLQTAATTISSSALSLKALVALLHDIGDELAPLNHSEYAASILKPYVSEKTHWIIEKHGEFQMYYYAQHLGKNQNQRDKYKDHEYFNDALQFCENWDQASFDPDYKSMTLEDFAPMIKRIFARKPYSLL